MRLIRLLLLLGLKMKEPKFFDVVISLFFACFYLRELIKKLRKPPVEETAEETDGEQRLSDLEEESEDSEEEDSNPSSRDSPDDQLNLIKL